MFVADGDVPDPVIQALQAVKYDILRYSELRIPVRPDKTLMAGVLSVGKILITRDLGIPSQAYLFEYAQSGLTMVLLRWKKDSPKDWQQMVVAILRDGESWEEAARQRPSLISVSRRGSRIRAWDTIPSSIAQHAQSQIGKPPALDVKE